MIVDNSGSVETVFIDEKEIAAKLVESLDISPTKTRVAMVQFNAQSEVVFPFNVYADGPSVAGAIRNVTQRGGATNVAAALNTANDQFSSLGRSKVNKVVLLVTDGNSQNTIEDIQSAVSKLNASGVTVFAASASEQISLIEFDLYTVYHRERWFLKNNITSLPSSVGALISGGGCGQDPVIVTQPPTQPPVVTDGPTAPPTPKPTQPPQPGKFLNCRSDKIRLTSVINCCYY